MNAIKNGAEWEAFKQRKTESDGQPMHLYMLRIPAILCSNFNSRAACHGRSSKGRMVGGGGACSADVAMTGINLLLRPKQLFFDGGRPCGVTWRRSQPCELRWYFAEWEQIAPDDWLRRQLTLASAKPKEDPKSDSTAPSNPSSYSTRAAKADHGARKVPGYRE